MKPRKGYDYVIIGSGFGGAFAAYNLARAGKEVLIVERGIWPMRDESCWDENILHLSNPPLYRGQTPALVDQKKGSFEEDWPNDTVGGMSTFYGAAAFRMREEDFQGAPLPDSPLRNRETVWPYGYEDLAPYYEEAERLQGVAGIRGEDITDPPRKEDFPQPPPEALSPPSRKIWDASEKMGLHPFHIPLAINFSGHCGISKCVLCSTCDHYLCKIEAKNDLTVHVIPEALKAGAHLLSGTRAVRINFSGKKAVSVDIIDQQSFEKFNVKARTVVLAGGALATPHLLLASGADEYALNGPLIGRYLMRHINGVVSGVFPFKTNPDRVFHRQVDVPDFYFGDPEKKKGPRGCWGIIQDIHTPGRGVIKENVPRGIKNVAAFMSGFLVNLLCIAEDVPQRKNRVYIDWSNRDRYGMPALKIYHRYAGRDLQARKALYRESRRILRKAGALITVTMPIVTFSHAFGTCRFGQDTSSTVLDPDCQVRGIGNLYVLDGSFMPSGGSVNPSLTIAANALKISEKLARE